MSLNVEPTDGGIINPTNRDLIDNLYQWLYHVMNRLDQIENPGMKPQWPEPSREGNEVG